MLFVVLQHDHPRGLHFDFMLETGDVLRTWALAEEPTDGLAIDAEALPDHRRAYLEYEGPVSGDRGTVICWDRGEYELVAESEGELIAALHGKKLQGTATLSHAGNERWQFTFRAGS